MPERQRFSIAAAVSLLFHLLLIIVIGLLAVAQAPSLRPEVLIPIELTVAERPAAAITLGGGGHTRGRVESVATLAKKTSAEPSRVGRRKERRPAPPRLLTAKTSHEAAGATGEGREAAGPGGKAAEAAGPSYGPSVATGPPPVYPKHALDQGLEGRVTLAVSVGADGGVEAVTVESSSGHPLLDEAAARAVKQGWAFKAGMAKGKPAPGTVRVIFEFSGGQARGSFSEGGSVK